MKKFLAVILHILSFVMQLFAFAFALLPIVYWMSKYLSFLSFIYKNEYILYAVSGALSLLIVLTGALIRIKRGRFIFAVLTGGVIFAGLSLLGLSSLTPIADIPDTFKVFAVRNLFFGILERSLYLYIAVGALLLIAFIFSAIGRRLRRKKAGKVKQKKPEPANMISSSQVNDKSFEPAARQQETFVNQGYVYQPQPEYAPKQEPDRYIDPQPQFFQETGDGAKYFEPASVVYKPGPSEPEPPLMQQPQRQAVYVRDEQGNLVLEKEPNK